MIERREHRIIHSPRRRDPAGADIQIKVAIKLARGVRASQSFHKYNAGAAEYSFANILYVDVSHLHTHTATC